ncbi:hypothetical protein BJV82DRAFT_664330 [Fennellomyces sp. T-0311]|nr:hypothetical protein BJV82DRAFT_664330 [Fennellomyces sp. T-0311]
MTTKLNLLKSDKKVHDEMLQVLDIMAAIINNFPDRPGKGNSKPPSELTCYRRFAQILDVMVRDTSLELDDGEQHFNLPPNEWKKSDVSQMVAAKQQSKNIRMNKAILTSMEKLAVPQDERQYLFTLGMDFKGVVFYRIVGYIFYVASDDELALEESLQDSTSEPTRNHT